MLQSDLLILGSMVEKAGRSSDESWRPRQVILEDDYIDQKRFQLEEQCVEIIAPSSPWPATSGPLHIAVIFI